MVCFFNDTATTEIYTLSLHDALPIFHVHRLGEPAFLGQQILPRRDPRPQLGELPLASGERRVLAPQVGEREDRKSTRLNSSHANISYAVFCLKKKKQSPRISLVLISL